MVFKQNNLTLNDIDLIAVPWNPAININDASMRWSNELRWRGEMLSNIPVNLMRILNKSPAKEMTLSFDKHKVVYLNHHECHANLQLFLPRL